MADSNLGLDNWQHCLIFCTIGNKECFIRLVGRDNFLKLSCNRSIRANTDLLVPGENGDLDVIFIGSVLQNFIVLGKSTKNCVGIALFRVSNSKFESSRKDLPSSNNWTTNRRLDAEIVISVNSQYENPWHDAPCSMVNTPPLQTLASLEGSSTGS